MGNVRRKCDHGGQEEWTLDMRELRDGDEVELCVRRAVDGGGRPIEAWTRGQFRVHEGGLWFHLEVDGVHDQVVLPLPLGLQGQYLSTAVLRWPL